MAVRLFWLCIIGFVLGITLRTFIFGDLYVLAFLTLLVCACGALIFLASLETRIFLFSCALIIGVMAGYARMNTAVLEPTTDLDAVLGTTVAVNGVVFDEPDIRENNVRVSIQVTSLASTTLETAVGVLVVVPLHTVVALGDHVVAKGTLRKPRDFEIGEGRHFAYAGYLATKGVQYELSFAHLEVLEEHNGSFKEWALALKQGFLKGITHALPEPEAGLAGGITVGDKRGLGSELSHVFRDVGLTHIVVLSGYNIMIVVGSLMLLLSSASRTLRIVCGVGVAILFAAMTGFASASTRAAAMAIIAILGTVTGRTYIALRALALVAAGMLLVNPSILLFDLGFQLSVLATAGLITLAPRIEPYLTRIPTKWGMRDICATTLGTQMTVLPLLLYQNGLLAVYALPANLFVLIAIPFAMLLSALAAIAGLLFGSLAPLFGFPAYILLGYIIGVAEFFSNLPFATLELPVFSVWALILTYLMIGIGVAVKKSGEAKGSAARTSNVH